jgi:hypothetical protein
MGDYSESKYGVFIIESMDTVSESNGKLDGRTLKAILDLCDIPNQYRYIRTKLEFEKIIEEFEDSSYRFLHLSCHADNKGIELTYEDVDFDELDLMLGHALHHRRLFLSACKVAAFELAEHFIPKYHCFSVIGTPDEIDYDRAAIFWSSFYYLMYFNDPKQMVQADILPTLLKVSDTFNVNLNYFSIIKDEHPKSRDHLKEFSIIAGKQTSKVRKTQFSNQCRPDNDVDIYSDSSDSS